MWPHESTILALPRGTEGNYEKSVSIASFQAEIQTEYLQSMRVVHYHYTNLLVKLYCLGLCFILNDCLSPRRKSLLVITYTYVAGSSLRSQPNNQSTWLTSFVTLFCKYWLLPWCMHGCVLPDSVFTNSVLIFCAIYHGHYETYQNDSVIKLIGTIWCHHIIRKFGR